MHHQKRQSSSRTTSHSRAPASSKCRSKQQSRTAQQWSRDSRPEEVGEGGVEEDDDLLLRLLRRDDGARRGRKTAATSSSQIRDGRRAKSGPRRVAEEGVEQSRDGDRWRRRCQAAPGASWTGGGRPRRALQTPAMDERRTGGWRPADGADGRRATSADGADGADGSRADGADGLRVTGTARTATNQRRDELQRAAAADGRDGRRTSGRCGWPRRAADGRPRRKAATGSGWARMGRRRTARRWWKKKLTLTLLCYHVTYIGYDTSPLGGEGDI